MDLAQAVDLYAEHARKGQRLSSLTVGAYEGDLRAFRTWRDGQGLSQAVEAVEPAEVERFCADCSALSPATVRRRLDAISSLYRFLVKRGLAARNPIDQVDRPRCPDSHRAYLTTEQMERLLAVADGPAEQAVAALLCLLGLRRSEVVSLDCGDVDLAAGRIQIRQSKGGHSRTLPIPPPLRPYLEAHLAQRDGGPLLPLFLSYHGNRLSRSSLGRLFTKWLQLAGLEGLGLSPHSARHGCASRWIRSGLTIVEVQQLLGHRSVDVTGRYCHASLDDIAASLEAKVPGLGSGGTTVAPTAASGDWGQVLSSLSDDQAAALLALARSMASEPSARGP